MNIGGIHIIFGLGFLLLTILLTTAYAYFGYLLIVSFQHLIYKFRKSMAMSKFVRGRGPNPDDKITNPILRCWNKRALFIILISATIIFATVYIKQRLYWMGADTAHHEAKEYFVSGQPAFGVRRIAELFLHPENPLLLPYTKLQRVIFKKGEALLPKNDGESAVWRNTWFFYLYTRTSKMPYGVSSSSKELEPNMVRLLDSIWATLRKMATKPYACKKAERDYCLSFPGLATYYNTYSGHYKGKFIGSSRYVRSDSILMERKLLLLEWLDEIGQKWMSNDLKNTIAIKYPGVAAFRFVTQLRIVQDTLLSKALNNQFSCEDPLMKRLFKMYQDAMSDDISRNSFLLYKKRNSEQAKILYNSAVYSAKGSSGKYLIEKICGLSMPEEIYVIASPSDKFSFCSTDYVEHVFRKELKIFIINGERND